VGLRVTSEVDLFFFVDPAKTEIKVDVLATNNRKENRIITMRNLLTFLTVEDSVGRSDLFIGPHPLEVE